MKITIRHQLSLPVDSGSARAVQHLLLTPLNGPTQSVESWTIDMPGIGAAARFTDAFGNRAHLVSQAKPEADLVVTVTGTVETIDRNGVLGRPAGEPVVALFRRVTDLTSADPDVLEPFKTADRSGAGRIALLHGLMGRIGELYSFGEAAAAADAEVEPPGSASQSQSQSQGVHGKSAADGGTARKPADAATFAHAFIGAARALNIPARYVTGYLAADEEHGAAFHAWAEAYDDGLGWIGFDAALGICPTDRHVRLAVGLDARSATPVRVAPELGAPKELEVSIEAEAGTAQ